MKLALIPPYHHVNSIGHTNYQLLLPQCMSNERYYSAYMRARANGDYLILDNGAAEAEPFRPTNLDRLARDMAVNEIVVPDVIGDTFATLEKVREFENHVSSKFNYMGVVQGQAPGDLHRCIDALAEYKWITCLGIPRHLLETLDDLSARWNIVRYIRSTHAHLDVHLLGTHYKFMSELAHYGKSFRSAGVRGVDTSAPFNYAYAGTTVLGQEEVKRPEGYFDLKIADPVLAYVNILAFKDWVNGH